MNDKELAKVEARNRLYMLIKDKYKNTDWTNRDSIHEYNEYVRRIRSKFEFANS